MRVFYYKKKENTMNEAIKIQEYTDVTADDLGIIVQAIHACVQSAFNRPEFDLEDTREHLWRE